MLTRTYLENMSNIFNVICLEYKYILRGSQVCYAILQFLLASVHLRVTGINKRWRR